VKPIRVGCSGWNYADWRGVLYPKGCPQRRWLERYAEELDTVEVNNTFYRLPSRDAVRGWVEQSPDDFVFAVKSSRYLTHMKRLTDMDRGVKRLLERLEHLVAEPALVAELEGVAAGRQAVEGEGQALVVAAERLGQLPEHGAHLG